MNKLKFYSYDTRNFFLFGMQIFFGLWFLYVGLSKWIFIGAAAFIGHITTEFDSTWSPHGLNVLLGWLILITEPILALRILSGKSRRTAWMQTSVLMFVLAMGQTILMKPEVIANWQYLVLTLVCAALSEPNS